MSHKFSSIFCVSLVYSYVKNIFFLILAGIMALCATSSYYDITEIATRILPTVVVLTIDPDRSVLFEPANHFCSSIPCISVWVSNTVYF